MAETTRSNRSIGAPIAIAEDHWKLFLLQGAGLSVLGIAAAILPNIAVLAVANLLGWLLFIAGLFRLASGLGADIGPGHRSSVLLSILMILLGGVLAVYATASRAELAMALAGYLAMHSASSLILAFSLRAMTGAWRIILIGGLIDALLAILLLVRWPGTSPWVFGSYLGINLIVAGCALMSVALGIHGHRRRAYPPLAGN